MGEVKMRFTWNAYIRLGELIVELSQPLRELSLTAAEARELGLALLRGACALRPSPPLEVAVEAIGKEVAAQRTPEAERLAAALRDLK